MQILAQTDVLSFMSDAEQQDVRSGRGNLDVTAAIQACLSSVAGKRRTVRFPPGTYRMGRVFPGAHTVLWLDNKTILMKKQDGKGLLRISNVENVHVLANGARLDATASDATPSHTVYFDSARNCSIRDANVYGAPRNKDCIYVGGDKGPSEDVLILGGTCVGAQRNGISVVCGLRTIIDGVEISGTTGAPGAGIDVEGNVYGEARKTEIRNCRIHDNQTFGVVVVFGDGVKIHHNTVFDNLEGIAAAAGGAQFRPGVYRPNVDVRGVARFDVTTGRVLVGGEMDTLPIGTLVLFATSKEGAVPATLRGSARWVVNDIRRTERGVEVLLGAGMNHDVKSQLSDPGSGQMSLDPGVSAVRMICLVEGQSSDIEIYGNSVYGNRRRGIYVATSVDVVIRDNRVRHAGTQGALQVSYVRGAQLRRNTVEHEESPGGTSGILIASSSQVATSMNAISGFPDSGIDLSASSDAQLDGDTVTNCGTRNGDSVRLRYASGLQVSRLRVSNDKGHPATYGVRAEAVTRSTFSEIDATSAGNSNANSIHVGENRIVNSRSRDGARYQPPSRP